jgi:hypothetical protein
MVGRGTILWGLLLAASAGVAGCSSGGPVKVKGTVTLDGKPFPGASVTFIPAAEGGRSATGLTRADGSFELTTFKPEDGALPGEYKITVLYVEPDKSGEAGDPSKMDPKDMKSFFSRLSPQGRARAEAKERKARKVIPDVYTDVKTTPLKSTVPVVGKVELDLKSTAH